MKQILRFASIALVALAGCRAAEPLRVMSFNIRYANPDDGPNRWEQRRDCVCDLIQTHQPDVLGLQEVLVSQAAELRAALPDYTFVGVGRDDGAERGEFVPLFIRAERLEILAQGQFWLSPQPTQAGSVGWDAALPRIATWVQLRDRRPPREVLWVANVHLDHRGVEARRQSARLLSEWIATRDGAAVLVLGDFNCEPDSAPFQLLTAAPPAGAGLRDVHRVAGAPDADAGTYHGFTGRPQTGRIDWILCSSHWSVRQAETDRSPCADHWPSDHFPVVATLQIRGRAGSSGPRSASTR